MDDLSAARGKRLEWQSCFIEQHNSLTIYEGPPLKWQVLVLKKKKRTKNPTKRGKRKGIDFTETLEIEWWQRRKC